MIDELKPYPEYRPSGIPWAPSLPAGWKTERAKWLFTKMARPVSADDEVVTCFRDGTVTLRKNRRLRGYTEATLEHGYQGIRKGDLVIHGMDAFAGAIGVSDSDGKGTPVYNVCRPKDGVDARYYAHALRRMAQSQWILALAKGIRERSTDFRYETFGGQRVPMPPLVEQTAIVRFVDWADGRLERTIRAKRKVIALLNEQKQAIIHRAVTRGLDPTVPLKSSGVPWLGDIPAHWELVPNRKVLRVRKVLVGELHPKFTLLSLTKRGVVVRDLSGMRGKFSSDMGTSQQVREGDLVFCLFDVPETPRTVGLSRHSGMITGAYTVMECKQKAIAEFLEMFYIAMDDRKLLSPLYSGLRNTIPKERLLGAKTPIPPERERVAILDAIRGETMAIDSTASRLRREIELLNEYRTRLVADVVTGSLDVREAAASLPDGGPLELAADDSGVSEELDSTEEEADE
jgi:type I restriction enzyme S subunit